MVSRHYGLGNTIPASPVFSDLKLTAADIAEIDSKLGVFAGRPNRDNWVDQAKLLVAGDVAGFEKKYGALGSEITKG